MQKVRKILNYCKKAEVAYLGMFTMSLKVFFSNSQIIVCSDGVDTFLAALACMIMGIYLIAQEYSQKELILYAVIGLLALGSVFITGQYGMIMSVITILVLRTVNIDKTIKYMYKTETCFLVVHTLVALVLGIIDVSYMRDLYVGQMRYHFGMIHPNTFSAFYFNLVLLWIWINYKKIEWKNVLGVLCLSVFMFVFTKTRTCLLSIVLIVALVFSSRFCSALKKAINWGAGYIVPLLAAVILVLSMMYKSGWELVAKADLFLNARIRLASYAYYHFGYTLMGQDLSAIKNGVQWDPVWQLTAHTFDSAYSYLAFHQGILWLVLICICFWRIAKYNDIRINICVIGWALYAVTETQGLNCYTCFPLLLIALLLQTKELRKNCLRYSNDSGIELEIERSRKWVQFLR